MATPAQYLVAYLKGLAGVMPLTQWIGMTPGDHYAYLAKKTTGTDPITGITAQSYQEKADSMQLSSRGLIISVIVYFYYLLRYPLIDQQKLFYWTAKSIFN